MLEAALQSLNGQVVLAMSAILLLAGVLGFLLPPRLSLMSGAAPYNVFHILFAAAAGACALSGQEAVFRAFNVLFGLLDLYQALASFAHIFPERHFRWKRSDDALHLLIGAGLVAIGLS